MTKTKSPRIKKPPIFPLVIIASLVALNGRADVLELKNGRTLNGRFVGGTAGTIRFGTSEGVQVIETLQALGLTFTGASAASAHLAATAAAPAPAAGPITIPAGTVLSVRMVDAVSSKDKQGKKFSATLDSDLSVNGAVVLQAATKFYGTVQSSQQARRYTDHSSLNLQLTQLKAGLTSLSIITRNYSSSGARSGAKVARGGAVGAAIGAIADEDAGKGAAIGAAASGVKKGETVTVAPGTLLDFSCNNRLPSIALSKSTELRCLPMATSLESR